MILYGTPVNLSFFDDLGRTVNDIQHYASSVAVTLNPGVSTARDSELKAQKPVFGVFFFEIEGKSDASHSRSPSSFTWKRRAGF